MKIEKLIDLMRQMKPVAVALIVAVIVIVVIRQCTPSDPESDSGCRFNLFPDEVISVTHTDTVYDSIPVVTIVYKPVPYEVIPDTPDWALTCEEVMLDYYYSYLYADTAINDSMALIIVRDTISRNRVQGRQVKYVDRTPTVINTTTTALVYDTCPDPEVCKKWNFGIGGFVGSGLKPDSFEAGVSAIVTTNKRSSYELGYDMVGKSVRFTMFFNLR
ncbi:hypothetical protein EOM86_11900 [Candidatus Nomurabacteria bacterium]|nr:hypothetical protein [Candidatus Nomurabacteria bacterium]